MQKPPGFAGGFFIAQDRLLIRRCRNAATTIPRDGAGCLSSRKGARPELKPVVAEMGCG
jgi:hypothetical protein